MNNKSGLGGTNYAGSLDFENYWGEKLIYVEIYHYMSNIFNGNRLLTSFKKTTDVEDKTTVVGALQFSYVLGDLEYLDYWGIKFITASNEIYSSDDGGRCSIRAEDGGKVILGVNGESKRMYISMLSGVCSYSLNRTA
ncbi:MULTISPECIES: hypothetical protein [Providencia]|uniref:hypothetical protein n=1 Tax=Providencia TaxID=586 RepID=UPI00300C375A